MVTEADIRCNAIFRRNFAKGIKAILPAGRQVFCGLAEQITDGRIAADIRYKG